jgi:hypothetical protein
MEVILSLQATHCILNGCRLNMQCWLLSSALFAAEMERMQTVVNPDTSGALSGLVFPSGYVMNLTGQQKSQMP